MESTTTNAHSEETTIAPTAEPKQLHRIAPAPAAGAGAEEEAAFECLSSSSDSEGEGGSNDGDSDSDSDVSSVGVGVEQEEESLVQRVATFFFQSDTFADTFERWVRAKAPLIDLSTTECRLEYTPLHEEFKALFEAELTAFIEAQAGGNATVEAFYEQLARKSAADPYSNEGVFAQVLCAVLEFDVFMVMMREAAEKAALARAKAEQELEEEEKEAK